MYPLHIGVLEMREATLPLSTITATTRLCVWQGRITKSKTYLQFIQMMKTNIYILHENKECMELHNKLLHNIIILIIINIA